MTDVRIHAFQPDDTPAICRLYAGTTRAINGRHYTPLQVERWAGFADDLDGWRTRLGQNVTIVAHRHGQILGFAELEPGGELGYVYVAATTQGQGIGTQLLQRLLRLAGERSLTQVQAEVSVSAMPFFAAQGFTVVVRTAPLVCGAPAPRYRMTCGLPPAEA